MARLEAIEGPAYRHGPDGIRRAAPSLDIAEGDWISTSGGGARARLEGPGGSRVDISGDASLGITAELAGGEARQRWPAARQRPRRRAGDDVRVFLAHGRASAVLPATRGGPALVLTSPHAIVSGEGTVRLDVAAATTRVEVREGRARVSALGVQRGTDVTAGQLAMVSAEDLQPPRAQNAPREALLLIGPDDTKEALAPPGTLRGSEELLKARLERLGFQVHVADAGAMTPERARAGGADRVLVVGELEAAAPVVRRAAGADDRAGIDRLRAAGPDRHGLAARPGPGAADGGGHHPEPRPPAGRRA